MRYHHPAKDIRMFYCLRKLLAVMARDRKMENTLVIKLYMHPPHIFIPKGDVKKIIKQGRIWQAYSTPRRTLPKDEHVILCRNHERLLSKRTFA